MKKIFALVLALMLSLGCVAMADTVEPEAKGEGVMTHEEYVAAEVDTTVTIEAYLQAKRFSEKDGVAALYTQDDVGGYFVYGVAMTKDEFDALAIGSKLKVTGWKAVWSGEIEIMDPVLETLEGEYIAEPIDVTELLASEELVDYQNMFVSFKGMTVSGVKDSEDNVVPFLYNWDGSGEQGSDLYFNVSVNDATYQFCVESDLCNADSDVYKAVEALKVGDVIDMEGYLYWYEGVQPHVTSVVAAAE